MDEALEKVWMAGEQDRRISEAVERERVRLRNFIRRRVPDERDAEDILQDVFYELVEAYRVMQPLEQVSGWLFRVARNRIVDLFRRRKTTSLNAPAMARSAESGDGDGPSLEDLLPSPEAGPDAVYARGVLADELEEALAELPADQREVFIANEIEGRSFKELAEESGTSINTLLSRKHYAVLYLRRRLASIHEEFTGPEDARRRSQ